MKAHTHNAVSRYITTIYDDISCDTRKITNFNTKFNTRTFLMHPYMYNLKQRVLMYFVDSAHPQNV
jgi:hypothetical protein